MPDADWYLVTNLTHQAIQLTGGVLAPAAREVTLPDSPGLQQLAQFGTVAITPVSVPDALAPIAPVVDDPTAAAEPAPVADGAVTPAPTDPSASPTTTSIEEE